MKEIDASIDRGEGGEEKEKERKEKESVYTEIFSILNKNGLGKGKTDLKTITKSQTIHGTKNYTFVDQKKEQLIYQHKYY